MKLKLTRFLLAGFLGWLVLSCGKDERCLDPRNPNCDNYDPCYGKVQPSAAFLMEEGPLVFPPVHFADTLLLGSSVQFRSKLTDAYIHHKWFIGADVYEGHTTPEISFYRVTRPALIPIIHVITYKPDTLCFPDDDGKDSVVQLMRLVHDFREFNTLGKYRGVIDHGADSIEVTYREVMIIGGDTLNAIYAYSPTATEIVNFHNRGNTYYSGFGGEMPAFAGIAFLYNNHGVFSGSAYLKGTIRIFEMDKFEMRYKNTSYLTDPDTSWHEFKGRIIDWP